MDASILESLFLGVLVLFGVIAVTTLVAGFLLWRLARRKLLAFRSHGVVIGATALWEATASHRWNRTATTTTAADIGRWSSTRVRKEMWRCVDRASAAVRTADEVGGPTAELPSLCRRLESAAADIDKVLRVDPMATVSGPICHQVVDVIRAADDVQRAAMASASEAGSQRIRELTEDAGHELTVLDAGLASMRSPEVPGLPRS
ncbi:MAG: hypothetical protein ABSB09_12370 [Acidimicrobiales bacterium]|jgi:hypothetical protein